MKLEDQAKEILEEVEGWHKHRIAMRLYGYEEAMVLDAIKLALITKFDKKCVSMQELLPFISTDFEYIEHKRREK